jgi:hypothetical protein
LSPAHPTAKYETGAAKHRFINVTDAAVELTDEKHVVVINYFVFAIYCATFVVGSEHLCAIALA